MGSNKEPIAKLPELTTPLDSDDRKVLGVTDLAAMVAALISIPLA
jgi:hypothetical protein